MREQFTFYRSFYSALQRIKNPEHRLIAYDMLCSYALMQQEPDLDSLPDSVALAFELLRPVLDKARSKAENGSKGGGNLGSAAEPSASKPEANPFVPQANGFVTDAPASKPQKPASKKEVEIEIEGEREVEVEVEREVEKEKEVEVEESAEQRQPAATASCRPSAEIDFSAYSFSPALREKLSAWFAYKQERRQGYTAQQKHSLLHTVEQKLSIYPESAILAIIDQCMVAGWKNIIFERLDKPGAVPHPPGPRPLDADERAAIRRIREELELERGR